MLQTINGGKEPHRATKHSAGVDLYSNAETITLQPAETVIIPLGVCINHDALFVGMQESYYLALHPRSSLRVKGLMANTGVVDLDFPGELGLILTNTSTTQHTINAGDRIAQVIIMPHATYSLGITSDAERTGGFGSTNN